MDQIRGTVRRDADRQVINPFDLYAMEAALRLQEEDPSTRIFALSMGPASAGSVLRDCIALGAENGYLVSDPVFAGSDVLASSYSVHFAKIWYMRCLEMLNLLAISFTGTFCWRSSLILSRLASNWLI